MLIIKSEKWPMTEGIELPNQEKIKMYGEKEIYIYLRILEANKIKEVEMKGKIKRSMSGELGNSSRANYKSEISSKE